MRPLTILGTGSLTLPVASNETVLEFLEAPHDASWLKERTGIRGHSLNFDCLLGAKRTEEDVLDYALSAAKSALEAANILPQELDQICYATCTPRNIHFMADVIELHRMLGLRRTAVIDQVDGGCAALAKAFQLVKAHAANPDWKALVIGANDVSSMLDKGRYKSIPGAWMSPAIFADGAAALVLGPGDKNPWLSNVYCAVDGNHPLVLYKGGGTAMPTSNATLDEHVYIMNARDVAIQFAPAMSRAMQALLSDLHLPSDAVGRWYLHQANLRLIQKFVCEQNINPSKVPHNVDRIGNSVSASTLILLHEDMSNNYATREPLAFVFVGAGMMEGGAVFLPQ